MLDIIIVEDNHEIGELLSDFLRKENYIVSVAKDGEAALELFERYGAKLVILDLMLPGMDGFAVCSKIRETSNAHILIVSAKTEKNDKLKGLNLGADDYIEKPYDMDILLAKIHGIFKRKYAQEELISGTIRLNTATQTIYVVDQKVDSTAKEFELLKLLMINAGIVLHRDTIMADVWGTDYEGESRTLDMHIKTLRHKLKEAGNRIKTVRNVGYRME